MEVLLEGLFEFLFEIIVEGAFDAASSRRVPLPLRIIAAVIVLGVFGGLIFLMIFGGVCFLNDEELTNGIVPAVTLFAGAALIAGAVIWKFVKFYKNRSREYSDNTENQT